MALLKSDMFEKIEKHRNSVHEPVKASYTIFWEKGEPVFQIDTYGTAERVMPKKVSQSLQIDREMASVLVALLRKEFHLD